MTTANPLAPEVTASIREGQDFGPMIERLEKAIADLARAIDRPPVPRLLLRADEVAEAIGVDRRTLQRMVSGGTFPKADVRINRLPFWTPATVRKWIERGGSP